MRRLPGFQSGFGEEFQGDGPEGFRDDLEFLIGWEVNRKISEVKPFSAAAFRVQKFGSRWFGSFNVIEEAAVNELLGDDVFVAVVGWKVGLKITWKLELVFAEVGQFFEVGVAGIGAGKIASNGEVEFGGELEVDELVGVEIPEKKVEFSDGGVNVFLHLEISFEEVEFL